MSGGQKQRVGLARALYSKKELILIDDAFSGLDAETEETVFVKYFGRQGLLRQAGATAILVTHAVTRLPYSDYIIALDADGQISEQGTFDQLRNAGGYVERLATKHKYESATTSSEDSGVEPSAGQPTMSAQDSKARANAKVEAEEEDLNRSLGELSTYKYYFSYIGWSRSCLSLFYVATSGTAIKLTELLITYWTNALSTHDKQVNSGLYLGLYGMLAGIGAILWVVGCCHFFLSLVPVSAQKLHARLLHTVMNAPLYFFTSIDTGVTTNRLVLLSIIICQLTNHSI